MLMLYGFIGALSAVALEVTFRLSGASYMKLLPLTMVLQLPVSWAIYNIVRGDSILAVSIFFSGATVVLRLGSSLWTGGDISVATWIAFGLTVIAMVVKVGEKFV